MTRLLTCAKALPRSQKRRLRFRCSTACSHHQPAKARMMSSFSSAATRWPSDATTAPSLHHQNRCQSTLSTTSWAKSLRAPQPSITSWNHRTSRCDYQCSYHQSNLGATVRLSSGLALETDSESDSDSDHLPNQLLKSPTDPKRQLMKAEVRRLKHIRNVGILAHVDAGKTTVTERMLALAGIVRSAGSVDTGNTVTDYLPMERERGITIQSAAISFEWGWHNSKTGDDLHTNDNVLVQLIDTPGHVDFSVEVNRSVAVLDGAVLVVDSVAGVQAQTETVWRAMTNPSINNHATADASTAADADNADASANGSVRELIASKNDHRHEPLPCLAFVNKMDREGCHFGKAMESLRTKLPGANPIAIQMPLFRVQRGGSKAGSDSATANGDGANGDNPEPLHSSIMGVVPSDMSSHDGEFVGVVDLLHMRAIVWKDADGAADVSNVENCAPTIINLLRVNTHEPIYPECAVTNQALQARQELVEALAEVDSEIEEHFLNDDEPSNAELRRGLRRAVLHHKALPVMTGAALRGKGVEPVIDAIADLLPSPLDRQAPALFKPFENGDDSSAKKKKAKRCMPKLSWCATPATTDAAGENDGNDDNIKIGHPLDPSLLALAFKVVHMKGRGGSGDGRVVFARVYSGKIKAGQQVQALSPPAPGEVPDKPRTERVGGLLELAGGRFSNLEDGECESGGVCALVGLKNVVTGDTLFIPSSQASSSTCGTKMFNKKKGKKNDIKDLVCLAGVASPKPVITVRLEAESSDQQQRLSDALQLMTIEDPSLMVEETDSATLLSGLGELHVEVTLDRLRREHGLEVMSGPPAVAYRETITDKIETDGMFEFDRTIGGTRLQASVKLSLAPSSWNEPLQQDSTGCTLLKEPAVTVGDRVIQFLGANPNLSLDDLLQKNEIIRSLVQGCQGALMRGPLQSSKMANIKCHIDDIDAEGGPASLKAMPGSIRAAGAHAITTLLQDSTHSCTMLEPAMSLEVTLPGNMVGPVLSDLTARRAAIGDVSVSDDAYAKAWIRGEVPLTEILGYANELRSLTAGEGAFTAEYKGHLPC